jgi:hypothetical protein
MATAVKRQHEPQRIIGDLLTAEVNEKQAESFALRPASGVWRTRHPPLLHWCIRS